MLCVFYKKIFKIWGFKFLKGVEEKEIENNILENIIKKIDGVVLLLNKIKFKVESIIEG